MKEKMLHIIATIESTPVTLLSFLGAFFSIIVIRLSVESGLFGFNKRGIDYFFFEFSHTFLFFLFSFLLLLFLFQFLTKLPLAKLTPILLFGFFIVITPPIIDKIIFGNQVYWSFYEFDGLKGLFVRYFTFFGDTPAIGITYGVRIEVFLVTLFGSFFVFLKTKSFKRTGLALLSLYTLLFVLGTFPSWLTLIIKAFSLPLLLISNLDVARLFLTPETILSHTQTDLRSVLNYKMSLWYGLLITGTLLALLWKERRSHFIALFHNARFPQIFYHGGLLILGTVLAIHFENISFSFTIFSSLAYILLIISVVSAWLTSVIVNDIADTRIDALTNTKRPLIKKSISPSDYRVYGIILFILSLYTAALVSFSSFLLIGTYQVFAWIYSSSPFRLKRIPFVNTFIAASASILILIVGYLALSERGSLEALPHSVLFFLLIACTLILPIKDFKDILGDKADEVFTLPVIFGEKKAKLFIGSALFLAFVYSSLLMNIPSLLPVSFLFGTIAFWLLQKSSPLDSHFISYRHLSVHFFFLTFMYGLFLSAFIIFNF